MARPKKVKVQKVVKEVKSEPVIVKEPEIIKETGIQCRQCKRHMRVMYTRPQHESVYRVRVCEFCGTKKPTREQ